MTGGKNTQLSRDKVRREGNGWRKVELLGTGVGCGVVGG